MYVRWRMERSAMESQSYLKGSEGLCALYLFISPFVRTSRDAEHVRTKPKASHKQNETKDGMVHV
jgi:hypothetical protein